jgi:hypothetical protein
LDLRPHNQSGLIELVKPASVFLPQHEQGSVNFTPTPDWDCIANGLIVIGMGVCVIKKLWYYLPACFYLFDNFFLKIVI